MSDKPPSPEKGRVGHKSPPIQHQFRKGVSGNPRGRPPKESSQPQRSDAQAQIDEIVLAEGLRLVQFKENGQTVEMPMIQAQMRSLGVNGVKGDRRSALAFTEMVMAAQRAQFEAREKTFMEAIEYKRHWEQKFLEYDRRGEPRPDPAPHPDDMVLDPKTLTVRINGPMTLEDKAHWDKMAALEKKSLDEVARLEAEIEQSDEYKDLYEREIRRWKWMAESSGCMTPDATTRRQPGFDLQEWREQQPGYRELMAWGRRQQRRSTKRKD